MLSQKPRKKPQNKRCKDGYPCKRSCISRKKECLGDEMGKYKYGQAKTYLLWLKLQEERLVVTNKKRQRVGLAPAKLNETGYITADRAKLPQSTKVEKAIAVPESSVAVSQPEKIAPKNLPDPKSAIASPLTTKFNPKQTLEDYAHEMGVVKPLNILGDISPLQSQSLNSRVMSTRAKQRQTEREKYKEEMVSVESAFRANAIKSFNSKEFGLFDAYQSQEENSLGTTTTWDVLKEEFEKKGINLPSPFSLAKVKNKDGLDGVKTKLQSIEKLYFDSDKTPIADSTPTEFAKSAIARLKSGQILLNPKEGYRIATSGKNDGMYSLSDPNISVQQGGKVQKLTEAEAIAFLNTKSPIPASPEPTPEETTKIAEAELIDRLNKSQSILPINVSYVIDTALDNAFETNSLSSLEIIKDANTIADGEKVITYTGYGSGDKQFGIGGGTRSYGFAVWDKAKGKARLSDGYQQGKLSTKHSDYYRVTDKSESIINTDRLLRKLDKEIDAITVNSPDLGNKVKAILDHVRTLPNGTAIAENIISELAKEVTPKSAANQKKIDEAIAPLAELANLRIDEKPKQTKIATDWISLAKSEKQQEESEMRRLQGTPDGLNPIKQPIKGKSVVQIQKQLDQQETGLFLKKHWNSYNLTDKDDILIADFNRIDTAVKYLNDPTALHNRQKFLANTRGHEVSHFVRSYEDPRSVGILYNPTKYTASFPVYQQQSPFGMNQARVKMLAGQERIPRKEARVILSAIYNGKILKESYNSIAEKNEIPENLIQLIKIALKQHPDLASEYPESVNAIKN